MQSGEDSQSTEGKFRRQRTRRYYIGATKDDRPTDRGRCSAVTLGKSEDDSEPNFWRSATPRQVFGLRFEASQTRHEGACFPGQIATWSVPVRLGGKVRSIGKCLPLRCAVAEDVPLRRQPVRRSDANLSAVECSRGLGRGRDEHDVSEGIQPIAIQHLQYSPNDTRTSKRLSACTLIR